MSLTPGSFRPGELAGGDGAPSDAELAAAFSTARELEAALPAERVAPPPGFTDRVMAAVALEPAPRRAGFLNALRARPGLAGLVASVREAWGVVAGGPGRPAAARGLALAYVLAVVVVATSLSGIAAYGAAGALGFLDGDASPSPSIVTETPEPSPTPEPTRTPEPSATPAPSASEEPSPSVSAPPSPRPTATPRPTRTPEPSDGHGDESPSPSPDDISSPDPGDTPDPSDTPKPSESPS